MTPITTNTPADPIHHSRFDRFFDSSLFLLVLTTVGAVGACMAHL